MKLQLAVIRGLQINVEYNGRLVHILERLIPSERCWVAPDGLLWGTEEHDTTAVESFGVGDGFFADAANAYSKFALFATENVFPIRDNPGNESWYKSAPLERAKPAEVEA